MNITKQIEMFEKHLKYSREIHDDLMNLSLSKEQLKMRLNVTLPTLKSAADYLTQNIQILLSYLRAIPPNG